MSTRSSLQISTSSAVSRACQWKAPPDFLWPVLSRSLCRHHNIRVHHSIHVPSKIFVVHPECLTTQAQQQQWNIIPENNGSFGVHPTIVIVYIILYTWKVQELGRKQIVDTTSKGGKIWLSQIMFRTVRFSIPELWLLCGSNELLCGKMVISYPTPTELQQEVRHLLWDRLAMFLLRPDLLSTLLLCPGLRQIPTHTSLEITWRKQTFESNPKKSSPVPKFHKGFIQSFIPWPDPFKLTPWVAHTNHATATGFLGMPWCGCKVILAKHAWFIAEVGPFVEFQKKF